MGETTEISWADATFNPWMGCTKVSPACAFCYAERDMDHRYGKVAWGPNGTRVITSESNWKKPLQWNRKALEAYEFYEHYLVVGGPGTFSGGEPQRPRVFCASLADVFEDWKGPIVDSSGAVVGSHSDGCLCRADGHIPDHNATMDEVRRALFTLIDATPNLDWLLLTKRPENIHRMWPGGFRDNVWLGTSVENQEWADKRIPELLWCRDLAPVLFLSCEPMVGPVDLFNPILKHYQAGGNSERIDWVITGGESGPDARPANPDWFLSLRDQCATTGVPFHFKQWGEFDADRVRVGRKQAGRLLDGVLHDAVPGVSMSRSVQERSRQ